MAVAVVGSAAAVLQDDGDFMMLIRLVRHLLMSARYVRRRFPKHVRQAIEQAVIASERRHSGELRVVIEGALDPIAILRGQGPRGRALEVFAQQRVWDTERNNGVLLYLLLADRAVEIVADRAIDRLVGEANWSAICRTIERAFGAADYQAGLLSGIETITEHLVRHDAGIGDPAGNELSDQPIFL